MTSLTVLSYQDRLSSPLFAKQIISALELATAERSQHHSLFCFHKSQVEAEISNSNASEVRAFVKRKALLHHTWNNFEAFVGKLRLVA